MIKQLIQALENVMLDSERLEHLQIHFSEDDQKVRGSKFKSEFIAHSLELVQYIMQQIQSGNYHLEMDEEEIIVKITEKSQIVGYDALAKIEDLSEKEKEKIEWKERFGFKVRCLEKQATETSQLMTIFRKGNPMVLKTVFPGHYAPAFPNKSLQTDQEYLKSQSFWNQHVLLT